MNELRLFSYVKNLSDIKAPGDNPLFPEETKSISKLIGRSIQNTFIKKNATTVFGYDNRPAQPPTPLVIIQFC